MLSSKIKKMIKKMTQNKDTNKCNGHQIKYYFKDMHSRHIDNCLNTLGCSHDCYICNKIRISRSEASHRIQRIMNMHADIKRNKAAEEAAQSSHSPADCAYCARRYNRDIAPFYQVSSETGGQTGGYGLYEGVANGGRPRRTQGRRVERDTI